MVQMPGSSVPPPIDTFVAIGDSFTEGLEQPAPGGGIRGWATWWPAPCPRSVLEP